MWSYFGKNQVDHKICALTIFSDTIVKWVAHAFRHAGSPAHLFLSRPLNERLTSFRLVGRRSDVSESRIRSWSFLQELGLGSDPPVGGFPQVRGHSGFVCRWGSGWFEEMRDSLGFEIRRHDKSEVAKRSSVLVQLFRRARASQLLSLVSPFAIEDRSQG